MTEGRPLALEGVSVLRALYLSSGIYYFEDMGHKSGLGLSAKKGLAGDSESPMGLRTAGWALYKKGTYGGLLGKGVSGVEEIKESINELAQSGVDFLKIINSGIVSFRSETQVTEGGFSSEEWQAIAETARKGNLKIRCHANSEEAIRTAVMGGAASIEHGFFITPETIQLMARQGVAWVPTVFALDQLRSGRSSEEEKRIKEIVEKHLQSISLARSLGVKIEVGTDSGSKGVAHVRAFFQELRLLKRAGLSREDLLAAACLGEDEVAKGNFLLVAGDFIEKGKVEAIYYHWKPLTVNPQLKPSGE
jgi:imidazolonepropionase-like amidohydrolase